VEDLSLNGNEESGVVGIENTMFPRSEAT
jgi:hypothetical protein